MANAYHNGVPATTDHPLAERSAPPGFNPPPTIPIAQLRARAQAIRSEKGLSINDLMMRSGLSRTAVLDLLNGRGRISNGRIDTWWALAWALETPFGQLMSSLDE